jgi:S-adenosylmethionine decarboxylase
MINLRGRKIKLQGFNNLTKSLTFNIYDICYARSRKSQEEYLEYIDEEYNSEKIKTILEEVTKIIDAKIVNISTQDYDPRGASVTFLINEGHMADSEITAYVPESAVIAHLDKSHIAAHTYPELNSDTGISTFRVDIDVSTCGMISPLAALDYLIESFESDVVQMDYRVRGFTRDVKGEKIFLDHEIYSIQDYISEELLNEFHAYDINILSDNIFHTKMMRKKLKLDDMLFGDDSVRTMAKSTRTRIRHSIDKEMTDLFEGRNVNYRS